jgi:transcriptional regulator with XRE-family HTH domain
MDHNTLHNLQTLRLVRGLSYKDMAEALFICERQYRNIESGKSPLNLDRLQLIAQVLNVPIKTFFVENLKEKIWSAIRGDVSAIEMA